MEKDKDFIAWLRKKEFGFVVEGQLHIYVGGGATYWKLLLPIFKKALISEYELNK